MPTALLVLAKARAVAAGSRPNPSRPVLLSRFLRNKELRVLKHPPRAVHEVLGNDKGRTKERERFQTATSFARVSLKEQLRLKWDEWDQKDLWKRPSTSAPTPSPLPSPLPTPPLPGRGADRSPAPITHKDIAVQLTWLRFLLVSRY